MSKKKTKVKDGPPSFYVYECFVKIGDQVVHGSDSAFLARAKYEKLISEGQPAVYEKKEVLMTVDDPRLLTKLPQLVYKFIFGEAIKERTMETLEITQQIDEYYPNLSALVRYYLEQNEPVLTEAEQNDLL